jgi:hypothetical protein
MPSAKTLYVREEDVPIWERAEQAAAATRQSVSQLVAAALRRYLPSLSASEGMMEEISVKVGDRVTPLHEHPSSPADYGRTEVFTGKWLVPPGEDQSRFTRETTGYHYAVALTKRGQIAVWRYHPQALREAVLDVFASIQEVDLPGDIHDKAGAALGGQAITWRDI